MRRKPTAAEWKRCARRILIETVDVLVEEAGRLNTLQALVRMRNAIELVFSETTKGHEDA